MSLSLTTCNHTHNTHTSTTLSQKEITFYLSDRIGTCWTNMLKFWIRLMGFNELTPRQRLTNNSKCRQPLCTLFYWRRLRPTGTASDKEKKKKDVFLSITLEQSLQNGQFRRNISHSKEAISVIISSYLNNYTNYNHIFWLAMALFIHKFHIYLQ